MKDKEIDIIRGSGNVYRDCGDTDADVKQLNAILAAQIIKSLDRQGMTVRRAHAETGIAAADFSRIRNADLGRFTVGRLMTIINRLGGRIDVKSERQEDRAQGRRSPHRTVTNEAIRTGALDG